MKYEQTIGDLKMAVEKKLHIPVEKQQLFWHGKELTTARSGSTLLELGLHTGASLKGYDLVRLSPSHPGPHFICVKALLVMLSIEVPLVVTWRIVLSVMSSKYCACNK